MNKSKQYKRNEQTMMFVLLLIAVVGMVQTVSARIYINGSNSGDSFNMEIPDTESQASYIVYQPWYLPGYTIAKNGSSGGIDYIGTNSAVVINSSIQNTQNGGTVLIKKGTYTLLQTVYGKKNVTIRGEGKYGTTVLKVANKVQSTLTSNANSGQKNLAVADTTGFLVGQDVTVFDAVNTGYGLGDSGRIASIDTGAKTITLEANLFRSYTVANNAYVFTSYNAISLDKPTFASGLPVAANGVTGVTIRDIEIDGNNINNAQGNYDEFQNGIALGNSHNTTIRDTYIHNVVFGSILSSHYTEGGKDGSEGLIIDSNVLINTTDNDGIHFHGVKNSIISNNYVDVPTASRTIYVFLSNNNKFINNNLNGSGDSVLVTSSYGNQFIGNTLTKCGTHCYDITSSPATKIFYGNISGSTDSVINFVGSQNSTVSSVDIISSGNQAIIIASSNGTVITSNNIYQNVGADALRITGGNIVVNNNIIRKTSTGNFGFGISNSAWNTTIVGNVVQNDVTTKAAISNTGDGVVIVANAVINGNTTRIYSNPAMTSNEVAHNTGI